MLEELIKLAEGYIGTDYYVHGDIPPRKLSASTTHHGVDPRDTVIALLDSTIAGSADNGMSITLKGGYWKNAWHTKTRKNRYTWEELAGIYPSIYVKSGNLIFEDGVQFGIPANYKNESLVNCIKTMASYFVESAQMSAVASTGTKEVLAAAGELESYYAAVVPEAIALCIAADGEVDDAEIEMATSFIESDELIADKSTALQTLSESIEMFLSEKAKSAALFKLKSATVVSKLAKLDDEQKQRLGIIVEGMLDSVKSDVAETKALVDSITAKIT